MKTEDKFEKYSFKEQCEVNTKMMKERDRKRHIDELIETIKAMQLIGAECSIQKERLKSLLRCK